MPRGRPKNEDAEVREWSIRLTPCDGEPIDFYNWFKVGDFIKCIVGKEYGATNGKLHYHIYCSTRRSDTWLTKLFYQACRWTPHHERGNAVFSKTRAHEGTAGYSVKEEDVVFQLGYTPEELDALIETSRQYRRDLETAKKNRVRKNQGTMKQFIEDIVSSADTPRNPYGVTELLLEQYAKNGMAFPSRSQVENATMTILYRLGAVNYVNSWYCKNF